MSLWCKKFSPRFKKASRTWPVDCCHRALAGPARTRCGIGVCVRIAYIPFLDYSHVTFSSTPCIIDTARGSPNTQRTQPYHLQTGLFIRVFWCPQASCDSEQSRYACYFGGTISGLFRFRRRPCLNTACRSFRGNCVSLLCSQFVPLPPLPGDREMRSTITKRNPYLGSKLYSFRCRPDTGPGCSRRHVLGMNRSILSRPSQGRKYVYQAPKLARDDIS